MHVRGRRDRLRGRGAGAVLIAAMLASTTSPVAEALANGLGLTPGMGWNSDYCVACSNAEERGDSPVVGGFENDGFIRCVLRGSPTMAPSSRVPRPSDLICGVAFMRSGGCGAVHRASRYRRHIIDTMSKPPFSTVGYKNVNMGALQRSSAYARVDQTTRVIGTRNCVAFAQAYACLKHRF